MYKHVFGPVPSRRLGMSLGIDLVPRKVCSLDCVYCEVGATTKLTVERKEYLRADRLKEELQDYFASGLPDPDVLTFSGSGEPTLNTALGQMIAFVKGLKPGIPVAVLTNGTLLGDPALRRELLDADIVLPSLDAALPESFQRLNRPDPSLTVEGCIRGLEAFRAEYSGRLWLEVFLLPGYNDSDEDLAALRKAIERIGPDRVQLNTLDRPGAVEGLRAASRAELQRALEALGTEKAEIVAAAPSRKGLAAYRPDAEAAIMETIARRPCTVEDLSAILGIHGNEVNKYLDVLEGEGRVEARRQERGIFYHARPPA